VYRWVKTFMILYILFIYCKQTYKSRGISDIYRGYFRENDCFLLEILSYPLYYSIEAPQNVTIRRSKKTSESSYEYMLSSSLYQDIFPIERVVSSTSQVVVQFNEPGYFSVGLSSFDNLNCDMIYMVSGQSHYSHFSRNSQGFFSLPINNTRCFFYASAGTQKIQGVVGKCNSCPEIKIYSAQYLLKELGSGEMFSISQQMFDIPTIVILKPSASVSDLNDLFLDVSTDSPILINSKHAEFQPVPRINPSTIVNYKGDSLLNILTIIISSFVLGLLSFMIYKEYNKHKQRQSNIDPISHPSFIENTISLPKYSYKLTP